MRNPWPRIGNLFGARMTCKSCSSANLQDLTGELTASLPDMKHLKASPIYVCREISVCLDCGFTELRLSAAELEQLKKSRETDS
jgi:hypothetical protein